MSNLNCFLLCCLFAIFFSCNSQSDDASDVELVGIWQNINQPTMGIEFDRNGNYYVLKHNERLEILESPIFKYTFNSGDAGNTNFSITEMASEIKYEGKLIFLDKDNIQLKLAVGGSSYDDGFFSRIIN